MLKTRHYLALIFIFALTDNSYGTGLDEPAAPTRPTVRTELKRGHEIAFNCSLQSLSNIIDYEKCIETSVRTQEERGTATEAFKLGVYFTAAPNAKTIYDVLTQRGLDATLAQSATKLYISYVDEEEKALNLSDKIVAKGFHMSDKGLQTITEARHLKNVQD